MWDNIAMAFNDINLILVAIVWFVSGLAIISLVYLGGILGNKPKVVKQFTKERAERKKCDKEKRCSKKKCESTSGCT
jgi:hypothetical protein